MWYRFCWNFSVLFYNCFLQRTYVESKDTEKFLPSLLIGDLIRFFSVASLLLSLGLCLLFPCLLYLFSVWSTAKQVLFEGKPSIHPASPCVAHLYHVSFILWMLSCHWVWQGYFLHGFFLLCHRINYYCCWFCSLPCFEGAAERQSKASRKFVPTCASHVKSGAFFLSFVLSPFIWYVRYYYMITDNETGKSFFIKHSAFLCSYCIVCKCNQEQRGFLRWDVGSFMD